MPEAIETSKRKFHKLLDSITAASNLPPYSLQSNDAALKGAGSPSNLTAREKMDLARDRARKRLRASSSATSLSTSLGPILTRNNNSSTTSLPRRLPSNAKTVPGKMEEIREPPNFSPWSQEMFLARLKTFSRVSLWHPKPEVIGEVQWAKRGWSSVDVNTVACKGGCEKRVMVKLDTTGKVVKDALAEDADNGEQEDEEIEEDALKHALAERYRDEIINGHSESCLWRKASCKDDIYRLSLVRPVVWQPELRMRYISLLDTSDSIKDVTCRTLDRSDPAFMGPEKLLAELPKEVLSSSEDTYSALKTKALDIALHGWRGSSESHADLLHCDACFQRIGLWMYQPGFRPSRRNTDEDADDTDDNAVIDVLEMHREHCPWRNATTQKGTGSLSGMTACEILNRVVSTYAREQRRRSEEQLALAREPTNANEEAVGEDFVKVPRMSREEVDRLDKEREGKLRRLKRMFTMKRSSKAPA